MSSDKGNNISNFFASLFEKENQQDLKNLMLGFTAIVISCAVFYTAYKDPKALTEQFYIYSFFGVFPILLGIAAVSRIFSGPLDIYKLYFYGGLFTILVVTVYMFYRTLNPKNVQNVYYLMMFLTFLAFIFGLAILYRIFVRLIVNTHGWVGFFLKMLFLIPCMIIDAIENIFIELKSAPKMVIILFILELLIILAYIYVPRLSKPAPLDSVVLLNKPVFLTRLQAINKDTGDQSNKFMLIDTKSVDNPSKDENLIRRNYSISMWIYVNQHPNSNAAYSKETNIFRYGYPNSKTGHPRVAYFNDIKDTNKSDKFIVYVNDMESVLLQIPMQSWNQLTITYNNSMVDIFVNGNLERSIQLPTDGIPIYYRGDIVEVGEGDNTVTGGGLHGAICNVVYYKTPLTTFQIAGDYNLNRYKNPPTNQ
jgi:hypothetical protein